MYVLQYAVLFDHFLVTMHFFLVLTRELDLTGTSFVFTDMDAGTSMDVNKGGSIASGSFSVQDRYLHGMVADETVQVGVATKIFEGFGEALFKELSIGLDPLSTVYYTRPRASINHLLH